MDIFSFFRLHERKAIIVGVMLFLVIRLTNLTLLPIFTDEAIYIRWTEIAMHADFSDIFINPSDAPDGEKITQIPLIGGSFAIRNSEFNRARTDLFIPLSDGKQPLFMWLAALPMWLTADHLLAGRLPAVLSGLAAVIGIWLLTREIFQNKKLAYCAAFIYTICPFTLMYDRLMLADSMLAMWGIYAVLGNIRLAKNPNTKNALILGVIYGLGLLTKSPALFYFLLAPLALVFTPLSIKIWSWTKQQWRRVGTWSVYWLIAVFIGQCIQAILRLSNMYHLIGRKNLEFIITPEEFIERPFSLLYGNMIGMSTWFVAYLGLPFIFCILCALIIGIKKRDIRIGYLAALAILPWVASASFNKVLYPRYLLFFTPPLLILVALGLYEINVFLNNKIRSGSLFIKYSALIVLNLVISSYALYSSSMILTNPPRALLPLQDREQYIEGWPSGYGVNEVYTFLKKEYQKEGKLAVGTEGTFGLMPFALQIKFYDEIYNQKVGTEKLFINGYWPFDRVPQEIVEYSAGRPAYFVVYQTEKDPPPEFPLELVMKIDKPGKTASMRLYKITPVWRYTPNGAIKSQ